MSTPYLVTVPTTEMNLGGRSGTMTFGVTNRDSKALQTRFEVDVSPLPPAAPAEPGKPVAPRPNPAKIEWFSVKPVAVLVPMNEQKQVTVELVGTRLPKDVSGFFFFRLNAIDDSEGEARWTSSSPVTFTLEGPKVVVDGNREDGIKWWMILIGVLVVLGLIGGILALVLGRGNKIKDVREKPIAEARAVLTAQGLTIEPHDVYKPDKPAGTVISEDPPAGSKLPEDKKVKLGVASPFTTVPCVERLPVAQAISRLKEASLDFEQVPATDASAPTGSVVTQNPRLGACGVSTSSLKVAGGSKIRLFVKQ